jgi:hypothetical protein
MASTPEQLAAKYSQASTEYDLDLLLARLESKAKKRYRQGVRRELLCALICGDTLQSIANDIGRTYNTVRKYASEIYQHIKELTGEDSVNASNLIHVLDKHGYKRGQSSIQPVEQSVSIPNSQSAPSVSSPNFVGRESAIASSLKPVSSSAPEEQYYNETCQLGTWIPNTRCRQVWGRENLIEQILNRLNDPQELSILSLTGGAGYGKTEAATKIAQAALNRNLFAYVLWVTARQTELVDGSISQEQRREALNWDKFLHEIAHQLACPVERVQQRLREEKLLVVLDNAETADVEGILSQLIRMLNPSRALLTSRLKTKPSYVELIQIPGLEERWSHRLLRNEAECNNIPVLLQASNEQLHRVHQLSCGAPLALHFVVGRVLHDNALEPVLSELEQASGQVEAFYQFCLETAWQRISDTSRDVLHYMGEADAGVTKAELSGVRKLLDSHLNAALAELRRWYLLEGKQDIKGNWRYDLHPWVRSSVRGGLVDNWQPSLQDLEQKAKWMFDI